MEKVFIVPVEVRCRQQGLNKTELSKVITSFIRHRHSIIYPGDILSLESASDLVTSTVDMIRVCDVYCPQNGIAANEADYAPIIYSLFAEEKCEGLFNHSGLVSEENAGELPACTVISLPNASLEGLWESLFYGDTLGDSSRLKKDLLQYMRTAMVFSMAGVRHNIVAWNRLLLLHGPPGTGKTSLCKALAHKLSIRLSDIFYSARLIEINAHSLFSRWFSESGKQVMLLFRHIHEMAEDVNLLICVLIDEVESLAAARLSAMKGNEPSDAIRVVNALLTQLDSLQRRQNVVVLATSNITGAIDVAFIDRADKKIFIGSPGLQARVALLRSSTLEMIRRGLIVLTSSFNNKLHAGENTCFLPGQLREVELGRQELLDLEAVAKKCEGFSGRTMKKLPFLAYSETLCAVTVSGSHVLLFAEFVGALHEVIRVELAARQAMTFVSK